MMKPVLPLPADYGDWLASLKSRIQGARQRALLSANAEQIQLYHDIGRDILERQSREGWGAKVIDQLSTDLRAAFPDMKGLSSRNLKYMKFFAEHCPSRQFRQQIAAQIASPQIGQQTAAQLLAAPRHGQQTADQLVSPPAMGPTLPDQLPWFHIVKAQAFKPEHAGQLNFYLSAVDAQVKAPDDKPTIGLQLCKTQNRLVAEPSGARQIRRRRTRRARRRPRQYALSGIDKPIGVAEYQLVRALPEPLDTNLPSIEEIEAELSRDLEGGKPL
jgi:hypothetical protein